MSLQGTVTWRDVCALAELEDPGTRGFEHDGWQSYGFVVREADGVYAYINVCPHAGHPLNYKPDAFLTKDGAYIMCSSHGAMFERNSGVCVAGPCTGRALRQVPVRVCDGRVQISLPASDDPA